MAELAGLPVPRMDWHSSDAPQAFKKFKALCELYFSGPLEGKSEAEQISYLLIWSGEEGIELVSTWSLSAEEKKKIDTYWTKFESYVSPKSNFRLARYKLRVMKQEKGETVDAFLKRIRVVVNECKFANTDEHIIDALIFGSNSQRVQSKLLEYDETLTLNKAIDIARTEEATTSQLQDIRAEKSINVLRQNNNNKRPIQSKRRQSKDVCGNCGGKHDFSQKSSCPAHGTKCRECGKLNHWRKMCRSGKSKDQQERKNQRGQDMARRPERPVHAIEEKNIEVPAQDTSQLYFHSLFINNIEENRSQAMLKVQVNLGQNTKPLLCKVDTGAEGNVIPVGTYKQLFPKSSYDSSGVPLGLVSSSTRITAFGGQAIEHFGTCKLALSHNDHSGVYSFHVVNTIGPTILGLPTCTDMKLVTLNYSLQHASTGNTNQAGNSEAKANLLTQYADRFEGIGCFKGEYHITLDPTVSPVVHPPRRVPEALRGPLKKELESLESQGIIAKVDEPTDWVNSLVCVTKPNGSIRLCLDPKDLNRAIKRPHHCIPTLDEILPKLNGARYFSIVDARSGYWNIQLDHESSLYTTFNTPHGRYRFLRLPFGLICAQDIFQKKVDETFGDLPGVTGIADDIIVFGFKEDRSDHDSNLKAVMERARETGVKFNPEKCKIGCTELPFFGHIVSASGLKMDPKKTEAIVNMDPSKSLADLQTFLGMTQYLSRFIPNLASFSAHLWDLTKKNSHFIWGPEHQSAVEKIKAKITSPNSLQYFDGSKPVTIQVDASQRGLGATLIQENGPVEYRSKLLTDTEARYSNIEREMLAVVYGLEKFHYYVYGRHVVVETDHKPLEAIFKKHLSTSPPRIARMMLRIQKYDIDIKYVPGKNVPMADALSRLDPCDGDSIEGIDVSIHEFQVHLNASPTRVEQIKKETAKDPELHSLKMFVTQGWPEKRAECPSQLHPYWNYRDELTVFDGMILKGTRVLIPKSLQPEVLNQLHYAHQGAEKCKLRAKGSVFWVNINADLEEMVKGCGPCQHNQKMNVREPLTPHDVPQKPWHTLGSDIFFWNNSSYLLVSDYFSKFPLVRKLSNLESSTTIAHLKGIFEEHGIPATLITGNDTQFTSAAFQEFCHVYGFVHVTTSPYYPQSNGFIERTVQTVKNLFQKCKESGADPHLAMLCLRTTPIDHSIPSPAELLNSRVYQSNLPAISKPQLFSLVDTDIPVKLQERQDRQKLQYDKSSKSLPPLYPMDSARMFNHRSKKWEPAVIQSARETPKSYVVKLTSGSTLIRNRRHIRPTGESFETESQDLPSSLPDLENPGGVTTSTAQDLLKPSSPPKPQQVPKTPPLRRSSRMVKPPERLNL